MISSWILKWNARISLRLFDHGFGANDDDNAAVGNGIAGTIGLLVVADDRALRQLHMAIDDGAADARVTPDIHMIEDDRILYFGIAIDAHIVTNPRFRHSAA